MIGYGLEEYETGLSGFFLIPDGCKATDKTGRHFIECPYKIGNGRLHRTQQLRKQLVTARKRSQIRDVIAGHHQISHGASFDHQFVIVLENSCSTFAAATGSLPMP